MKLTTDEWNELKLKVWNMSFQNHIGDSKYDSKTWSRMRMGYDMAVADIHKILKEVKSE